MRKSLVSIAIATTVALATPWIAAAAPSVGAPAPAFTGTDTHGQKRSLADAKGKYVVLEWHNQGCPFVKKHYDTGNMQKLQKELTGQGVVWYSVISSAPGKQGHVTAAEEDAYLKEHGATPTAVILDEDGSIGRLYGAKTTPHMFVIDDKGTLVYAGAIDDNPSADKADVEGAKSYVLAAYQESKSGKPVSVATTAPYGCSVKYDAP
jgi:peroxiredoxin